MNTLTNDNAGERSPTSHCSALCHFKDAGDKTITQIMRWSIMNCDNPEVTTEIQRLGSRLKLLISLPPNDKASSDEGMVVWGPWQIAAKVKHVMDENLRQQIDLTDGMVAVRFGKYNTTHTDS